MKRLKDGKTDLARSLRVRVRECTIDKVPFGHNQPTLYLSYTFVLKQRDGSLNVKGVCLITHIEKCVRVLTMVNAEGTFSRSIDAYEKDRRLSSYMNPLPL